MDDDDLRECARRLLLAGLVAMSAGVATINLSDLIVKPTTAPSTKAVKP